MNKLNAYFYSQNLDTTKEKHWETVGGSIVPAIDRIEFEMIESNKNLAAPAGRLLNSRQYRTMSYIPDEGLTLETSVFESFTVAILPYRPCG